MKPHFKTNSDSSSITYKNVPINLMFDDVYHSIRRNGGNNSVLKIDVNTCDNAGYNNYIFYGGWQQHFLGIVTAWASEVVGYEMIFNSTGVNLTNVTCAQKTVTISTLTFTFDSTVWGGINLITSNLNRDYWGGV